MGADYGAHATRLTAGLGLRRPAAALRSRRRQRPWARAAQRQVARLETSYRRRRAALEREIAPLLDERENSLRRMRQRLARLDAQKSELERCQRSQLESGAWCAGRPSHSSADVPATVPDPAAEASDRVADRGPDELPTTARLRLLRFYHMAFGRLPNTTRWHPYHTMLRRAMAAVEPAAAGGEILVVSSGGRFGPLFARAFSGRSLTVTTGMLTSELYRHAFRDTAKFDLCLCDLAAEDLTKFRDLLPNIRHLLKERSRIVVFHHNAAGRRLDEDTFAFTRSLFPIVGRSRITFAGSYFGALLLRWYTSRLASLNIARPASIIALAGTLAICAPIYRLIAELEERRNPHRFPTHCTSMTIEIDLP
jgi:hypothetical protein